jgi:hypothetical protein
MARSERKKMMNIGGMEDSWARLCEQVLAEGKVEVRGLDQGTRMKLQTQFNTMKKALKVTFPATFARYEKIRCFKAPEDGLTFSTKHIGASISDFFTPRPEFAHYNFTEDSLMQEEMELQEKARREKEQKNEAPIPAAETPRTMDQILRESGFYPKGE